MSIDQGELSDCQIKDNENLAVDVPLVAGAFCVSLAASSSIEIVEKLTK